MLQYQLPVAAILAATGIGSLLVLCLTRSQQPKIQLLTSGEVEQDECLLRDPFDVTRPEDFVDGYPINEVAFWNKAGSHTTCLVFLTYLYSHVVGSPLETVGFRSACGDYRSPVYKSRVDLFRRRGRQQLDVRPPRRVCLLSHCARRSRCISE